MKIARILGLVVIAALVLGACGPRATPTTAPPTEAPPAEGLKEVTILLPYIRSMTFYSLFVADAMGYFEDEGLDVTVEPGDGGSFAVQQVAAGQVEVGMANPAAVLLAVTLGGCGATSATQPSPNPQPPSAAAPAPVPPPPPLEEDVKLCPADVKRCPDGSWVSRNPARDCAFDPCPGER